MKTNSKPRERSVGSQSYLQKTLCIEGIETKAFLGWGCLSKQRTSLIDRAFPMRLHKRKEYSFDTGKEGKPH